jgi:hypothetical protein
VAFFRFDDHLADRLALTVRGPLEVNWRKPTWSSAIQA